MEKSYFSIIVVLVLLLISTTGCVQTDNQNLHIGVVTASVHIDFGNGTVWEIDNITTTNATVYGFLIEAAKLRNFSVDTTYYGQFDSIFINSIAGVKNGENGRYWQYWINGEYGRIGADKQVVNNSDIIEWKFTSSQL